MVPLPYQPEGVVSMTGTERMRSDAYQWCRTAHPGNADAFARWYYALHGVSESFERAWRDFAEYLRFLPT